MATSMEAMLKIAARVEGANTIQAFSRDLKSLDGAAKLSTADLGRMQYAINKMGREAGNTTSGIRAHVAALENLRSRVDIGSKAYGRLGTEIDQLRGKLRGLDGEVKRSGINLPQVVGGAAGALLAGVGVAGAGATAAAIGRVGIDAETAQVRLKALTEEFGEYNQAQASAARIAATLRISQIEASDGLSKLYAALRPTGVTLQEVEDAFIGFTAAARASGSTATESSAALLQLKQALGSGVLQGDELRSIREQAPAAAQAIAKEMGVTVGELKKLGSEGKITTDIVLRALARLKGESLGKLNAQFATSGQAMKDLQVATENFGASVARVFGPNTVKLIRGVTTAVEYLGTLMENPFERAKAAQFIGPMPSPGRTAAQQQASDQAARERAAARARAEDERRKKAAKEALEVQIELDGLLIDNLRLNTELGNIGKDRISQLNAEINLIPKILELQLKVLNAEKGRNLGQSRDNTILVARNRSLELEDELAGVYKEVAGIAAQAADLRVSTLSGLIPQQSPLQEGIQKVKQELLDADKAAEDLLGRLSKLAGTGPASGPAGVAIGDLRGDLASADPNAIASQRLLQGDTDALKQQIAELQAAGRELTTLDQLVLKYGADWDQIDPKIRASLGALAEQKDKLVELNRVNERNKQLAEDVAGTIGNSLGSAMDLLIDGTESWGNSLKGIASGVLKDIARQLTQTMVIAPIVKGITKSFGFADGGIMSPSGPLPLKTYSRGGIASSPQLALYGEGSMNEAYVPLPDGRRIPVAMQGGSTSAPITVMVNVDAKGTQVEGNQTEGAQLGRAISAAVQAELVKQQRPGGILAGTRR